MIVRSIEALFAKFWVFDLLSVGSPDELDNLAQIGIFPGFFYLYHENCFPVNRTTYNLIFRFFL